MNTALLEKYDRPVPRYTSYPTVPYWSDQPPGQEQWRQHLRAAFTRSRELSLYIHLPFCEKLCTYCGCNKRITMNHGVEEPYIEAVLAEWQLYLDTLPGRPLLREIHLGGGTPTFFSATNLRRLLSPILANCDIHPEFEGGFEAHPTTAAFDHLQTLRELGFRRISIGVQDFNPAILLTINRPQTEEQVSRVTDWARELGYDSINYDLIFGLPHQTQEDIRYTVERLVKLRPERIAFYSYAHVPWIKPSQRAYSEADLPSGAEKRALYELSCNLLQEIGYHEIGLDHFSLDEDGLYQAQQKGELHRNFMGYTTAHTELCVALGASSIGDTWTAYAQNEKKVEIYQERVLSGEFPLIKGYELTEEDQIIRRHILNLMCRGEMQWHRSEEQHSALFAGLEKLHELEQDGLIEWWPFGFEVTPEGRPFLRNIALAFDSHYWAKQPQSVLFSQSV